MARQPHQNQFLLHGKEGSLCLGKVKDSSLLDLPELDVPLVAGAALRVAGLARAEVLGLGLALPGYRLSATKGRLRLFLSVIKSPARPYFSPL